MKTTIKKGMLLWHMPDRGIIHLLNPSVTKSQCKQLPVTPLHYPIAKIIHRLGGKIKLTLPALIVGSMVPDLEVPFVFLWTGTQDRLVLHSLIGGLTFGTLITVALTVLLYPVVISKVFPIDKMRVKANCRFSFSLVLSASIGVLSHVLLDVANHSYNPLFWPLYSTLQTPSPIVPLLGGELLASFIVHVLMIILIIALLMSDRKNFWNKTFVG